MGSCLRVARAAIACGVALGCATTLDTSVDDGGGALDASPVDGQADAAATNLGDAAIDAVDAAAAVDVAVDVTVVDAGPCPQDGLPCDDGDPCSHGDSCLEGACVAGAVSLCACQTDLDCVADADLCLGAPTCRKDVFPYRCEPKAGSAPSCVGAGAGPCQLAVCQPATGACALLPKADGTPCVDSDACTVEDSCQAGACKPGPAICACKGDADCTVFDDGDPCNGSLTCDKAAFPHACKVAPASIVSCEPGAAGPCKTLACDKASGACKPSPMPDGAVCSDGEPCTASDACEGGSCKVGVSICACQKDADCAAKDDGDLCNGALHCVATACVVDAATIVGCDSKLDTACQQSTCQAKTGACALAAAPTGTACDDGEPCTAGDACAAGACKPGPDLCLCKADVDCAAYEDGDACNGTLVCVKHQCMLAPKSIVSCDPSGDTACSKAVCQPTSGACQAKAVGDGIACSDGDACTVGDACKAGTCKAGADVCECKVGADCAAKEDGDLCNGTLNCAQNICVLDPASVVSCGKPGPCQQATCQQSTGKCQQGPVADGTSCDDGDACTGGDSCQAGSCQGGASSCAGPTWAEVYQQAIAGQGCAGCHGGYGNAAQAYQTITTEFYCGGKLVVPGDPGKSSLVAKLVQGVALGCGSKMPKGAAGIPKAAGEALQAWIAAGAKF